MEDLTIPLCSDVWHNMYLSSNDFFFKLSFVKKNKILQYKRRHVGNKTITISVLYEFKSKNLCREGKFLPN